GGSLLRRSRWRRGSFQRAGRRTYGVRSGGCALWVGRYGFQRRRTATLGRGRLGRPGKRARALPLGARLGRTFLRQVALFGRREVLAVFASSVGHQEASPVTAGPRPGPVGNGKDRPRTMPPRAP